MPKYLVLWEIDQTKIPVNPKERGSGWAALMKMVGQDLTSGTAKDWGTFLGENRGYTVHEGPELAVMKSLQKYIPFVTYKVYPIASESLVNELIKELTG